MRNQAMIYSGAVIAGLAIAASVAFAVGATFNPAGDSFLATSTNISFGFGGGAAIKCPLTQIGGSIPSPAASKVTPKPTLIGNATSGGACTTEGLGGITFTGFSEEGWPMEATSATSVTATFPHNWAFFLTKVGGGCTILPVAESVVSGTWSNGEGTIFGGFGRPSILIFAAASLPITHSGTGCPTVVNEAKSMTVSATFYVNDAANLSSNVTLK